MYFIEFKNHENLFLGEKKKHARIYTTCDQMASSYNFIFEKKKMSHHSIQSVTHTL